MNPESHEVISMDKSQERIGIGSLTYSSMYEEIFFTGENNGSIGLNIIQSTGELKRTKYPIHNNKITQLISSQLNEKLLISMGLDQTVCLFDLNDGKVAQKIQLDFPILCGDINEADYTLVVAGTGGNMIRLDLRKLSDPSMRYLGHHNKDIYAVDYNKRLVKVVITS